MKFKNIKYGIISVLMLVASGAAAIKIGNPTANALIDKAHQTVVVTGSCRANLHVKLDARDSANKVTDLVWAMCTGNSDFWAQVNVSALKDGALSLRAFQIYRNKTETATVVLKKNVADVVTPAPSPKPTPSPTTTPTTPPVVTNPPATVTGVILGVNGHDGRTYYPMTQADARFKLLDANNIRSYRFDIDPRNYTVLDQLVILAKKYNITLRPMVYPLAQSDGYNLIKRYGNDIKVWEVANEQDSSKSGAQDRINAMVTMYKGMKQASDEMGAGVKYTINVMSCNSDDTSAGARCPGDKAGSMWFLDMAKASGFNFDYISFHYYPYFGDKGYWMDMYLSQMRGMATKYKTKIFYNEMNCGDVYQGSSDGGHAGDRACYDSIKQMYDVLKTSYADIVSEINMYELVDQPDQGGAEAHFGMMYDINNPKPNFSLLSTYAKMK